MPADTSGTAPAPWLTPEAAHRGRSCSPSSLDATYTAKKRAEGLLDFTDLEREGLRLLRTPAGEAVLAEFDHVLVDEYQDTNRLQEAILDRLTERSVRFGVGDEKQSIYRFRHADAGVFQELQERSERHPLGGSFRSRPELLAFTNALFRDLFEGTGVAPQDLRTEQEWRPRGGPCVELIAPAADSAAAGRRREAQALARRMRDIVDGREIPLTRSTARTSRCATATARSSSALPPTCTSTSGPSRTPGSPTS